jgi:hypothetical protein
MRTSPARAQRVGANVSSFMRRAGLERLTIEAVSWMSSGRMARLSGVGTRVAE